MGVAVADYDNDGDPDIYISTLETDRLFQNRGNGTFFDVTEAAGTHNPGFGTSCAWFDYNTDGHLDLYVANYVEWSIENDLFCTLDGINKSYCTPESYTGQSSKLFRNRGNGTFADVSRIARIEDNTSKSLGVCIFDYNADGLPDIFEANDTQPNKLYQNNGDGTFIETGMLTGIAYNESGVATGAMGIDAADYDRTGRESLVIGNFSNEMLNLYHNEGDFFIDDAPAAHIGNATLLTLTFACFFFDFDLDGNLDIFTANGHVETDINAIQSQVTYAQSPIYSITTPTANSPKQSTKSARIWQSRWLGEAVLMAISTTTAIGTSSSQPPTALRISSETMAETARHGLKFNSSDKRVTATASAHRSA